VTSTLRAFSYGGGIQSTAALVLAARKEIDFPLFLFSNVGDDSEAPDSLRYVREIAIPYAAAHGIELVELHRTMRDGTRRTLYEELTSDKLASIPIPVYNLDGAPGRRSCTNHYKVKVIAKETKRRGATPKEPAVIGLGISIDEWQRMNSNSGVKWHRNEYPLIDMRLSRADCHRIIADAGLPSPGKSSCWFCPYKRRVDWQRMKNDNPSLFMNAVVLEQDILAKGRATGNDPHYLTRFGMPINDVIGDQSQINFDDEDDTCESGFCFV
jgi:hypothetical protein